MSTVDAPFAFQAQLKGPGESFAVDYEPNGAGGDLTVLLGCLKMRWPAEVVERRDGGWSFQGMTVGSTPLWGDQFWFVLEKDDDGAATLQLWGDRVVVREARGVVAASPRP